MCFQDVGGFRGWKVHGQANISTLVAFSTSDFACGHCAGNLFLLSIIGIHRCRNDDTKDLCSLWMHKQADLNTALVKTHQLTKRLMGFDK